MKPISLEKEISSVTYPGRGIVIGRSADGTKAVIAYFIMGRSENSRNRIFVETEDGIKTQAFDESKLIDPSLIIYSPVRKLDNKTIVTNGDQTDTIYELMNEGETFEESLRTREFEPDGPNYTPRISGIVKCSGGVMEYAMSILRVQTVFLTAVRDIHLCIPHLYRALADIFTLIWVTALHSQVLRVSLHL